MTPKLTLSEDYLLQKKDSPDGSDFIFNIQDGRAYRINASTYDFLSLCNGELGLDDILQKFCSIYAVSIETAKADFEPLVSKWIELKILVLDY